MSLESLSSTISKHEIERFVSARQCSPVWSKQTVTEIKHLEGLQRRAMKNIHGSRSLIYEQRLRKIGLPTLEYRRMRQELIKVYRILGGIDEIDYKHFFELVTDSTHINHQLRGHPRKICKARYNKQIMKNSCSHRVVNTWNKLSNHVVMSPSLNAFKSRLNTEMKNNPVKFNPSFLQ